MAQPLDAVPLPRRPPPLPEPGARELLRRAERSSATRRHPVVLAGNGVVRARRGARAARVHARDRHRRSPRRSWARARWTTPTTHALGTVGLQERDYALAGFEDADVVIAVGYDLVEHAPEHWNPRRDKTIVVVDSVAAEIDALLHARRRAASATSAHVLTRLAGPAPRRRRRSRSRATPSRLRDVVLGRLEAARDDDAFPVQPAARAVGAARGARPRATCSSPTSACTSSGSRGCSRAHEPNTVLIANGLAGMGFALPCAIAAKLVHPERRVVAVCGDGGFLMNVPGARDGDPAGRRVRHGRLGGRASTARSSGSSAGASAASTSARTSAIRTSCGSPSPSACRPGAVSPRRTSAGTCATR